MKFNLNGFRLWPIHIEYHDTGSGIGDLSICLTAGRDLNEELRNVFETATAEQIHNLRMAVAEAFGCTESYLEDPESYSCFGFDMRCDNEDGLWLTGSIPV